MNTLIILWSIAILLIILVATALLQLIPRPTRKQSMSPLFPAYIKENGKPKQRIIFKENLGNHKLLLTLANGERREYYDYQMRITEDLTRRIRETLIEIIPDTELQSLQNQGVDPLAGLTASLAGIDLKNLPTQESENLLSRETYRAEKSEEENDRRFQRLVNNAGELIRGTAPKVTVPYGEAKGK